MAKIRSAGTPSFLHQPLISATPMAVATVLLRRAMRVLPSGVIARGT
jgi:hypothetical protein